MNRKRETKLRPNNKTGVAGVHWNTRDQRWVVRCFINGQRYTLGYYRDFDKAVEGRRAAEALKWKMQGQ
jgi:hypothetical protein